MGGHALSRLVSRRHTICFYQLCRDVIHTLLYVGNESAHVTARGDPESAKYVESVGKVVAIKIALVTHWYKLNPNFKPFLVNIQRTTAHMHVQASS